MRTHKQLLCCILLTCGMISHIVTGVDPDSNPAEVPGMDVVQVIGAVNGDSKTSITVTADMYDIFQEYAGTNQIVQDPTVLYEVMKQLEEKVKVLSVNPKVNSHNTGFLIYSELNIIVLAGLPGLPDLQRQYLTLQLVRVTKRCYAMNSGKMYLFEFYKGINDSDYNSDYEPEPHKRENRFIIRLNLAEMYDGSFKCPDFYGAHVKFKSSETKRALYINAQLDNRMTKILNIFSVNGDDTSVYPLFETVYWTYLLLSQEVFRARNPDQIISALTKNLIIPHPSIAMQVY